MSKEFEKDFELYMSYKPLKGPHHTKTLSPKAKKALEEFEEAVRAHERLCKHKPEGSIAEKVVRSKRNKLMRMLPWVPKPLKESSSD